MYLAVLILASFIVQILFLKENVHEFCSLETCRSYFHFKILVIYYMELPNNFNLIQHQGIVSTLANTLEESNKKLFR